MMLRFERTRLTALLAAASLSAVLPCQEWARIRGPKGQGHGVADLPAVLTEAHVRWRIDVGAGHSSPVLWGASLFLTRVSGESGRREIACYDADSGEERWSRVCDFDPHEQHELNSFASSTPAVDEEAVYILWTSGERLIARAMRHDGEQLWRRDLGGFYSNHGSAVSPVLCAGLLVVVNEHQGEDCFITGLDRHTGKPAWRIDRKPRARVACYSSPFLYEPEDGREVLLLASYAHGLTAIEPASGDVRWQADLGFQNRFVASPCLSGDSLLVNTGSGGSGKECVVFGLGGAAAQEPRVRYRLRRGLPYVPSALAINGRFYLFSDSGFCSGIDAESGETLWRERTGHRFFSSPVTNGAAIYIGDREGRLLSFAVDRHEELSSIDLGGSIYATPALARGCMFVRAADQLVCLGPELK